MSTVDTIAVARLLTQAIERRASDLHLSAGSPPLFRIDGELTAAEGEAIVNPEFSDSLLQVFLSPAQQQALTQQRALSVGFSLENRGRYRVHVSYQKDQLTFDIRCLPWRVPELASLGVPPQLTELTLNHQGMVFISGPLGSGRTTTLAALVDHINRSAARHVVLLEDPIGYLISNDRSLITQRDIGDDLPTVEAALAGLRDEDVDVVGVDVPVSASGWRELMHLASAGTLVLVVAEADSTVRLFETLAVGWPGNEAEALRALLSEAFLGAVCQRLVPRLGGGRLLVPEFLLGTPAVRSLIRDGRFPQIGGVLTTSREDGMVSLEQSLAQLVRTGEVEAEKALRHSANPDVLHSLLRAKQV